jgi:3-oxo-5,6-didehydrosuberyl-CoA/3-oxoadipyl-CoA thiolase
LLARNAYIGMIETAQNVADRYQLSREETTRSRCAPNSTPAPPATRRLAKEIMPVTIPATRKTRTAP